jgi:transposase-like protein
VEEELFLRMEYLVAENRILRNQIKGRIQLTDAERQTRVWLYYRLTVSYRDVQERLFERGIDVSHEALRKWCGKFGQDYANQLRRRRPRPGDKWHLDEGFLTINSQRHYLW